MPLLAARAVARITSSRSPALTTRVPDLRRGTTSVTERAHNTVSNTRRVAISPSIITSAPRWRAMSRVRGADSAGLFCTTPQIGTPSSWLSAAASSKSAGARLKMTPTTVRPALRTWEIM